MVWLGGFNSDMGGTKAVALGDWAAATGRAYVRFDYFGHGASSGDFTPYGPGDPITRELLEDGARWSVLPGPVACRLPLRVLQGGADADVPWAHAMALAQAWEGQDVVFTRVRDGDHRLSRPQDLSRLIAAVEELG